jgi:hypothetical protein
MATKYLLASALFVASLAACTGMPFGLMGGGKSQTQSHSSETETSSRTEQINGHDVEEPEAPPPPTHHAAKRVAKKDKNADLGKTCHKNTECAQEACFTGAGDLGYCTHVCNDFSDCPFNYECKHVGNAPQMICQQEN